MKKIIEQDSTVAITQTRTYFRVIFYCLILRQNYRQKILTLS